MGRSVLLDDNFANQGLEMLINATFVLPACTTQGRLTHCNIAAEGASNRMKNQNFGGPQAGGQQWGMMGQQQQYPGQGGKRTEWRVSLECEIVLVLAVISNSLVTHT